MKTLSFRVREPIQHGFTRLWGRGYEKNVTKMQKLLARHKLPIYPNFVV